MDPVRGLGFLDVRIEDPVRFDAVIALYRDTLGLAPFREEPGRLVWFRLGDVDATRARMEAAGVEFLWETQRDEERAWAHYRGPDGTVYGLIGPAEGVRPAADPLPGRASRTVSR